MREVHIQSWEDSESEMEANSLFLALLLSVFFIEQWSNNSVPQVPQFYQGDMHIKPLFLKKKKKTHNI